MYGAIVIDPRERDPVAYDREYVVQLSDWSDEDPNNIYAKLKKQSDYYNFRERTAGRPLVSTHQPEVDQLPAFGVTAA